VTFDWQPPACDKRNGDITAYDYEVEALDEWVEKRKSDGNTRSESANVRPLVPYTRCAHALLEGL
jgi:hypothetical protein